MADVTVGGGGSGTVQIPQGTGDAAIQAQQLASAISARLSDPSGGAVLATYTPGRTPTVPSGFPGVLLVSTGTPQTIALPRAFTAAIVTGSAADTVTAAGSPDQLIIAGNGGLTLTETGGGGYGSVVAGDGANTISIPSVNGGQYDITTGTGNDTINVLSGSNTVRAGGGNNTINVGTGYNVISSSGNDVITAAAGNGLGGSSGADTIGVNLAGPLTTVVNGLNVNITFIGGSGGAATVYGGAGSDTVFGQDSDITAYAGTRGGSALVGGTRGATLVGGGNGDQLFARGTKDTTPGAVNPTQVLRAGTGNETLFGGASTLDNVFFAGSNGTLNGQPSQANTLIGLGDGNNTVYSGTGNETVISGAGADLFVFTYGSAGGIDLIGNFGGGDRISLQGYGAGEVAQALATQQNAGSGALASTTITLSDNTRITFSGGVSSLKASDFV